MLILGPRDEEATTPGDTPVSGEEKQEVGTEQRNRFLQEASFSAPGYHWSEHRASLTLGELAVLCGELLAMWRWVAMGGSIILSQVTEQTVGEITQSSTPVPLPLYLYFIPRSS